MSKKFTSTVLSQFQNPDIRIPAKHQRSPQKNPSKKKISASRQAPAKPTKKPIKKKDIRIPASASEAHKKTHQKKRYPHPGKRQRSPQKNPSKKKISASRQAPA